MDELVLENEKTVSEDIKNLIPIRDGLRKEVNELRKKRKDLVNYGDRIVALKEEHRLVIEDVGRESSKKNELISEIAILSNKRDGLKNDIATLEKNKEAITLSNEFESGKHREFVEKSGERVTEQNKEIEKNNLTLIEQKKLIDDNAKIIGLIVDRTKELGELNDLISGGKKELLKIQEDCKNRLIEINNEFAELQKKDGEVKDRIKYQGDLYALIVKNLGIFWVYAKNLQKYYDENGIKLNVLAGLEIPTGLEKIE